MNIIYFTLASIIIFLAGYDSVKKIKYYAYKNEAKKLKAEKGIFLILVFTFIACFFMLLW